MAPIRRACVLQGLRATVVSTLVVTLLAACAQSSTVSAPPAAPTATSGVATTTRVVRDVTYGPDPLQQLDLYLPSGTGPFPSLLYLHSGGWVAGSHEYVPDFVLEQVERGIAVIAVDYRLAARDPDGAVTNAFPAPAQDVDRAVRWVRAHAAEWGLDPDTLVLAGASAGGQLALLAAAAPGQFVAPDLPAQLRGVPADVAGVMAFVAPSDLVSFIDEDNEFVEAPFSAFLGCPTPESTSCDRTLAAAASPATYLTAGAPPAFFVYGKNDTLAPPATQGLPIATAWAAARSEPLGGAGAAVQFHLVDAGHNLDRTTVDEAAMEEWLDAVTEVSR